jgi:DNA-binding response OmpR family regulator
MATRILIVDDEPDLRAVMRLALETRDYAIEEAGSGEEALARHASGDRWNVILLDERLPGLDGLDTLAALRDREPDALVIMVTAYASVDLAVEAMKAGATDFVQKPMTPDTLRRAVSAALSKTRGAWVAPPSPAAEGTRAWEVWTLNGFHVVDARAAASPTEPRFELVQGRDGPSMPVSVAFGAGVVAAASRAAGRDLAADASFWVRQGGLALAEYVWACAGAPPAGRLVVDRLSRTVSRAATEAGVA